MKIESIEFDKSVYLTSATKIIVPFLTTYPFRKFSFLRFMIDHFCCLHFLVDNLPLRVSLLSACCHTIFCVFIFSSKFTCTTVTCFDMAVSDWAFDSSVSSVQSDTTFAFATTS